MMHSIFRMTRAASPLKLTLITLLALRASLTDAARSTSSRGNRGYLTRDLALLKVQQPP
jgi:hypothetical protein